MGIGRGMASVPWTLVRHDLAHALCLIDEGFQLWPVIQDGQPLQEYACMSKPYAARVLTFADHVQSGKFCAGCGRMFLSFNVMLPRKVWAPFLRTQPLRDKPPPPPRNVYTDEFGSILYITTDALAAMPESLRREIRVESCEVVESLYR